MTDIPALALGLIALALARRAFSDRGADWSWLFAGSICATLAYGIRQTMLMLPLGLSVYCWHRRCLSMRNFFAIWVMPILGLTTYQVWLHFIHGPTGNHYFLLGEGNPFQQDYGPLLVLLRIGAGLLYCGLFTIPLAFAFWCENPIKKMRAVPRSRLYVAMGVLVFLEIFLLCGGWLPFPHDGKSPGCFGVDLFYHCSYLSRWGLGCFNLNGMDHRAVFFWREPWFWKILSMLACVSCATIASAAAIRPGLPPSTSLAVATLVPQCAATLLVSHFFDRYLLALMPAVILLGRSAAGVGLRARTALWIMTVSLGYFSWAGTADYLGLTQAAWTLGHKAVSLGFPPGEVHANLDWCRAKNDEALFTEIRRLSTFGHTATDFSSLGCLSDPAALVSFKKPPQPPHIYLDCAHFFSPLSLRRETLYLYKRSRADKAG